MLRAVLQALGRPVALHSIALFVALGVPATILFAGNGMRAADVVNWSRRSTLVRGLLWAGWITLSAPAVRALFVAPGSRTLRALRLPSVALVCSLGVLCAVIQLPWLILFASGGGLVEAWAAVSCGAALGASVVAVRQRRRSLGFVLLSALLLLANPPVWVRALCGSVWLPFALHDAWRSALEYSPLRLRLIWPMPPALALSAAHLLRLGRAARARLMLALVTAGVGGIGLTDSLRNDPAERPVRRAVTALAVPLTLAAAACVAPILEHESQLRVTLRSLRVPRRTVLAGFLLAVSAPSSALAATTGVAACVTSDASVGLPVLLVAWAASLSFAVGGWGRLLEASSRRSAGTFAAGVTLIAAIALLASFSW